MWKLKEQEILRKKLIYLFLSFETGRYFTFYNARWLVAHLFTEPPLRECNGPRLLHLEVLTVRRFTGARCATVRRREKRSLRLIPGSTPGAIIDGGGLERTADGRDGGAGAAGGLTGRARWRAGRRVDVNLPLVRVRRTRLQALTETDHVRLWWWTLSGIYRLSPGFKALFDIVQGKSVCVSMVDLRKLLYHRVTVTRFLVKTFKCLLWRIRPQWSMFWYLILKSISWIRYNGTRWSLSRRFDRRWVINIFLLTFIVKIHLPWRGTGICHKIIRAT